jgi:hypothetical protein
MLLDPDPLVMPSHLNVNQGLEELLRRDPKLENDLSLLQKSENLSFRQGSGRNPDSDCLKCMDAG